jgi:hypothetical protein
MSVNSNKRAGGFARMGGMIMGGHDAMPSQKPFNQTVFQEDRPSVLSRGLSKSSKFPKFLNPIDKTTTSRPFQIQKPTDYMPTAKNQTQSHFGGHKYEEK